MSFFHSKVSYSILFLGLLSFHNLQKLFKIQKKTIRKIENKKGKEKCKKKKEIIIQIEIEHLHEFIYSKVFHICDIEQFNKKCY